MNARQSGVSLSGLLVAAVILIVVSLLGLKLAPAYLEYNTIKTAVVSIAQEQRGGGVADIRKAFDRRAAVDSMEAVTGADLEITKDGGELLISFAYRKEVPMFSNIGVYIEFAGSSKD